MIIDGLGTIGLSPSVNEGTFIRGEAAGVWAVGWKAALGSFITAREFAVGGIMHALHAGDAAARQFFRQEFFFRTVHAVVYDKLLGVPCIIWCACIFSIFLVFVHGWRSGSGPGPRVT